MAEQYKIWGMIDGRPTVFKVKPGQVLSCQAYVEKVKTEKGQGQAVPFPVLGVCVCVCVCA